jgi:hypothetical protein
VAEVADREVLAEVQLVVAAAAGNGDIVTATGADGWAFVWWLGSATAKTVTEYAANGHVVTTLNAR